MMSTYSEIKAAAQETSDKYGFYYRVRADFFGNYYAHMVPKPRNQYGADLDGELIQPSTYREADW